MALLLPGLDGARRKADTAACINNARQVVLAWLVYASDANDVLPLNADGLAGGMTNWVPGNMMNSTESTNVHLLLHAQRSLLASYVQSPLVFKCPSDESRSVRSIAMNCRLNPHRETDGFPRWVGGLGAAYRTFQRLTAIDRPSSVFVCVDEASESINDGYFAVDLSNTGRPYGVGSQERFYIIDYPAPYHTGGTVFSFADGHCVRKQWSNPEIYAHVRPSSRVPETSADVDWLQAQSSYK